MFNIHTRNAIVLLSLPYCASCFGCQPKEAGAPRNIVVAEDRSLTPAAYMARGLPALDGNWSPRDYETASRVLADIAKDDPRKLPRYKSKTSGTVFERVLAIHNIELVTKQTSPIGDRFRLLDGVLAASKKLILAYATSSSTTGVYDTEELLLAGSLLRVALLATRLAKEFRASLPADDPLREKRQKGFDQMKLGFSQVVDGALGMLSERQRYRRSECIHLVKALQEVLPQILSDLPPVSQNEVPSRIQALARDETDAALKKELENLDKLVGAKKH
jgi:hypothetical protein